MALKIVRGRQRSHVRAVIYGTEGIGKSTLASQFPTPLVLDTEDGTRHLDVARVSCPDWATLEGSLHELARDAQGFETVVIDSVDWAERAMIEQILRTSGKKSIEDFGFGKGYTLVAERIGRFLQLADDLVARGLHVVLVAHAQVKRTSPPDMQDGFDRYELKLTKQTAPIVKEWSDLLLFATYKTSIVEGADGRKKAAGGKERVMYAERSAAWDAKNRFGLPSVMPMGIGSLASIFEPPAVAATVAAKKKAPADVPLVEQIAQYIRDAKDVRTLGRIGDRIEELASDGQLSDVEVAQLMGEVNARHNTIEPEGAVDAMA
jgi:hypothetical protein